MPSTYVEVSPSGSGLHVWGFADLVQGRRTGDVEIYGAGRYITVTGRRFRGCGVEFANLDDWISDLLK
jgi:primase-polymerase (primpol)-like protein